MHVLSAQELELGRGPVLPLRKTYTILWGRGIIIWRDDWSRIISKEGYAVALIARGEASLKAVADELNASGGDVSVLFFYLTLE